MSTAKWPALESNPACFNEMLKAIGVTTVKVEDVYMFDAGIFEKQPLALLLCFSNYKQAKNILNEDYADLVAHGVKSPEGIFVAKQRIENACGTFALFNALANLEGAIDLGNGEFKKWLDEAKNVGEEERSDLIEKNDLFKNAHEKAAKYGETDLTEEVDNHFISYVIKDNAIYEIDSRGAFPRPHGKTIEADFVVDTGDIIKSLMEKLNSSTFAVMALVPV